MDPDAAPNLERLVFEEALDLPPGTQREAFLQRATADDPVLRNRVEALLNAEASGQGFLPVETKPGAGSIRPFEHGEAPGDRIGRYKLLEKIGEGGMGVVYMAEQETPVRRRVALKVIKVGMDTRSVVARFEAERQALALMDHPHIARVLDGGETETGRPFFVMELVQGIPITEFCDLNRLSAEARLRLFVEVCAAIQSAHQKGIVHRDIKPSNVLVTLHNGQPMPKVIDFGIAKAIHERLTEKTLFTRHAMLLGTPAYMSPEQTELSSLDVDTRADIYSLGVLLYELLTGTTPFPAKRLRLLALGEIQRVIREEDPQRPSTRLSTLEIEQRGVVAQNRATEVSSLNKLLRGDLDWVVLKCLEKDRTRRYDTATALAADILLHLGQEPVTACPPSVAYRFGKTVGRHRTAFLASAAVLTSLVLGLVLALWQAAERTRASRRALLSEAQAKQESQRAQANAEDSRHRLRRLYIANGAQRMEEGDLIAALPWLLEAWKADTNDLRRQQLHRLRVASTFERSPRPVRMWFLDSEIQGIASSPDGAHVLATTRDGVAALWALDSAEKLCSIRFTRPDGGRALARFSANGERAVIEGTATVVDWDAATSAAGPPEIRPGEGISQCLPSLDGRLLVIATTTPSVSIWDAGTRERLRELAPKCGERERFAFVSADSLRELFPEAVEQQPHLMLSIGETTSVRVWDADLGQVIAHRDLDEAPAPDQVSVMRFSTDGGKLALALNGQGRFVTLLWDLRNGHLIGRLPHDHHVYDVAFSPDGATLVTCGFDRTARLWDTRTGRMRVAPLTHDRPVSAVSISPGSQLVATLTEDRIVRVWNIYTGQPATPPLMHSGRVRAMVFGRQDNTLLTGGSDGVVRVWDLAAAPRWIWKEGHADEEFLMTKGGTVLDQPNQGDVMSPDGKLRLEIRSDEHGNGLVQVKDVTGNALGPSLRCTDDISEAAFSDDGSRYLISFAGQSLQVFDALTSRPISPRVPSPQSIYTVSFTLNDEALLAGCEGGLLRMWDAQTGDPLLPPFQHGRFPGVGFYAQVARLLDGGRTLGAICGEARFWELPRDTRTSSAWEPVAKLVAGHRVGEIGALEPLDAPELERLWQQQRADPGGDFAPSGRREYDWHLWRAEVAMGAWDTHTALPHLAELIRREPGRFRTRWLRVRAHEYEYDWAGMAEDLRACIAAGPHHVGPLLIPRSVESANSNSAAAWLQTRLACAELAVGNEDAFRENARLAVSLLAPNETWQSLAYHARALAHGPLAPDTARALRIRLEPFAAAVENAATSKKGEIDPMFQYWRSMLGLLFRENRFSDAVAADDRCSTRIPTSNPPGLRIMALQRAGRTKEAAALWTEAKQGRRPIHPSVSVFLEYPAASGIFDRLNRETDAFMESNR
ncbi:MAG: protein kinase [Verrucomicrobiales bacterium]|nr:protein kinase [Verrucomicrobiales bacterium]